VHDWQQSADDNENTMSRSTSGLRPLLFVAALAAASSLLLSSCAKTVTVDTAGDVNAANAAVLQQGDLAGWVTADEGGPASFTSNLPAFPELAECPPWFDVLNSGVTAQTRGASWFKSDPLKSFRSDVVIFETEAAAINALAVAQSTPVGQCLKTVVTLFAEKQTTEALEPEVTGKLDTVRIPALGSNDNAPWHFKTVYKPITDTATTQSAVLDYVFDRKGRSIVFFQISEAQLTDLDILPASDERVGAMTKVYNRLPEPEKAR
jgi:hypothetical protein